MAFLGFDEDQSSSMGHSLLIIPAADELIIEAPLKLEHMDPARNEISFPLMAFGGSFSMLRFWNGSGVF